MLSFVYFKTCECFKEQMVLLKDDVNPGWAGERAAGLKHLTSNLLHKNSFQKLSHLSFTQGLRDLGKKKPTKGLVSSFIFFLPL